MLQRPTQFTVDNGMAEPFSVAIGDDVEIDIYGFQGTAKVGSIETSNGRDARFFGVTEDGRRVFWDDEQIVGTYDAPPSTSYSPSGKIAPSRRKARVEFRCLECGAGYTARAAERAATHGCRKCGGVDIDLA